MLLHYARQFHWPEQHLTAKLDQDAAIGELIDQSFNEQCSLDTYQLFDSGTG
jgi:hypothetical protein